MDMQWDGKVGFAIWAHYWIGEGAVVCAHGDSLISPFVGVETRDGTLLSFDRRQSWNIGNPTGVHSDVKWIAEYRPFFNNVIECRAKDLFDRLLRG